MVWLAESPTIPDQPTTTIIITQADQLPKEAGQKKRILGVCEIVNGAGESAYEAKISIEPTANAEAYMYDYEGKEMHFGYGEGTKEYIVQQPKYGVLIDGYYYANTGYVGDDFIIAQVEKDDIKVEVHIFIHVLEYIEQNPYDSNCNVKTNPWKISAAPSATLTTATSLEADIAYALTLPVSLAGLGYTSPVINFTSLDGAAVDLNEASFPPAISMNGSLKHPTVASATNTN